MEPIKTGIGALILAGGLYATFQWGYSNGYDLGKNDGRQEAYIRSEKILNEMRNSTSSGIEEVLNMAHQKARAELRLAAEGKEIEKK